jgi:hypothetical protein
MLRTALPLFLLCAALPAQTNSTLTFTAAATAASSIGNGLVIQANGTGTLTGYGTAQVSSTFNILDTTGISGNTPITATLVMIFGTGDVLLGQLVVPAGYVVPRLGQSTSAAASFTITGGSGGFLNASGSFPNLTIIATPTGNNASVQGSGSGTVFTPSAHTTGAPSYVGSFAHFASGAGWDTIITLVNNGTANAQAQVNFYDESGNPATLPLDFPQGTAPQSGSTYSQTLKPGGVLVIDSQGGTNLSVGSAQLLSDGNVNGFLIFRYLPTMQEAAVSLLVKNASTYTLPFDNTGGIATGIAMSVISSVSTSIQILVQDDKGTTLATDTITLPGHGHTSFVLGSRYAAAGAVRGSIQFQPAAGSEIGVIGIRALPTGAYTTIPPIGN